MHNYGHGLMLIAALLNFELPSPTVPRWSGAYQWRITGDALDSEMLCVFIFNELIVESSNYHREG